MGSRRRQFQPRESPRAWAKADRKNAAVDLAQLVEEFVRRPRGVAVRPVQRAVVVVGAGLNRGIDDTALEISEFSGGILGNQVEFLNGIR